jgi:hypothetical protein
MTEIMIDPNVRVAGDLTFSGFEDVLGPMPTEGKTVLVREPEANLVAAGVVKRVDNADSLIYIAVEWDKLAPDVLLTPAELPGVAPFAETWTTSQRVDHTTSPLQPSA